MRFPGDLNVDINEISMNLVPFPKLKYIISSLSPLYTLTNQAANTSLRKLDIIHILLYYYHDNYIYNL